MYKQILELESMKESIVHIKITRFIELDKMERFCEICIKLLYFFFFFQFTFGFYM